MLSRSTSSFFVLTPLFFLSSCGDAVETTRALSNGPERIGRDDERDEGAIDSPGTMILARVSGDWWNCDGVNASFLRTRFEEETLIAEVILVDGTVDPTRGFSGTYDAQFRTWNPAPLDDLCFLEACEVAMRVTFDEALRRYEGEDREGRLVYGTLNGADPPCSRPK